MFYFSRNNDGGRASKNRQRLVLPDWRLHPCKTCNTMNRQA